MKNTSQKQEYIKNKEGIIHPVCILCNKVIYYPNGIHLRDGTIHHRECYRKQKTKNRGKNNRRDKNV